jgi:hypothetical protein
MSGLLGGAGLVDAEVGAADGGGCEGRNLKGYGKGRGPGMLPRGTAGPSRWRDWYGNCPA